MSKRIIDFSRSRKMKGIINLFNAINTVYKNETSTSRDLVNLKAPEGNKTFEATFKGEPVQVRLNSAMPTAEMFSIAQELVRPAAEKVTGRQIFAIDDSFSPGATSVGMDILSNEGDIELSAIGQVRQDVARIDASVGRIEQPVGKLEAEIYIPRDTIQQFEHRNRQGISPVVDLVTEKLAAMRDRFDRSEDRIIWTGGRIKGIATPLKGVLDLVSNVAGEYGGDNPTKGRRFTVPNGATSGVPDWYNPGSTEKTNTEILSDILVAAAHIMGNGLFVPNMLALPHDVLVGGLALKTTTDLNTMPLIQWIQESVKRITKVDLQVVGTNALKAGNYPGTPPITGSAFMFADVSKENMAVAVAEDLTLMPAEVLGNGDIRQYGVRKTGGFMLKRPGALFIGDDIG